MTKLSRPPPKLLFVHNGHSVDGHLKYLTEAGLNVSESAGAEDAVTAALALQPDIIVLDFSADGETVAALRQHEETKDVPVIALAELLAKA
jgi:CheY-like chemotaxis protein